MVWKSDGDQTGRKYDFGYDPANRLMKALFEQNDAGMSWSSNKVDNTVKVYHRFSAKFTTHLGSVVADVI